MMYGEKSKKRRKKGSQKKRSDECFCAERENKAACFILTIERKEVAQAK